MSTLYGKDIGKKEGKEETGHMHKGSQLPQQKKENSVTGPQTQYQ